MQTIKEIRKYVSKERRREYEGYNNMLEYFRQFDLEQLDYLETKAKIFLNIKNSTMNENITVIILAFTFIITLIPQFLKDNINFVLVLVYPLTGLLLIEIIWFGIMEIFEIKKRVDYEMILKMVKKIKEEKQIVRKKGKNKYKI